MNYIKNVLPVVFIALLCILIISMWFRDGKLLATGEEGLFLSNPSLTYEMLKPSWISHGPGYTNPVLRPRLPFYYLAHLSYQRGIEPWIFQEVLFYMLILIGAISMYYLAKEVFRNSKESLNINTIAVIAAIFYLFNPVSLLGVWGRFIYSFMFFYALIPLFILFYIRGINNKDLKYIFIAPLVTLPFSYAFGTPALVPLLWLLPFVYSSVKSLSYVSHSAKSIFPMVFFSATLIVWLLLNLWWIIPYLDLFQISYTGSESVMQHNVGTLIANSKDFTLNNVIRLIHGGFLYRNEFFGPIYNSIPFIIISYIIPVLAIYGLISIKDKVIKKFLFISFLIVIFLVKGTSFPFGQFFLWLFKNVPGMILFRNPLEKVGLLLPVIYALLFTIGTLKFAARFKGNFSGVMVTFIILSTLVLFHWPLLSGAMATYGNRDIRVKVPNSFQEANLQFDNQPHMLLSLPLMGGASGLYKWEYGYKGIDASHYLFNQPIIAALQSNDNFYGRLIIGISGGRIKYNLIGLSQLFSADFIVFRKDIDVPAYRSYFDAKEIAGDMIKNANLVKVFDSPEFSVWEIPEAERNPLIYVSNSVFFGNSADDLLDAIEAKKFSAKEQTFICQNKDLCLVSDYPLDGLHKDNNPDKVIFEKVSSTEYQIKVLGSKGKFLLVFANRYHPGWVLFSKDGSSIDTAHLEVNGYANGFVIDKTGDLDFTLSFTPEVKYSRLNVLFLAPIVALVIIVIALLTKSIIFKHWRKSSER